MTEVMKPIRYTDDIMTERGCYLTAVKWIAWNDEPEDRSAASIASYISTNLVADVFERTPRQVAEAVLRQRSKT